MLLFRYRCANSLLVAVCAAAALLSMTPAFAGLNRIYNSGEWAESQLVPSNYVAVAENTNTSVGPCYAALSTGGIDYLTANGAAWTSSPMVRGTTYRSIAEDAQHGGNLYAARADGGIDWITWNTTWQAVPLLNGNYIAVAGNLNTSVGGCYGARSDGGIDLISYSGGWQASPVVRGTYYRDIAEDPVSLGCLYGVRTDGGIDWINYNGGWLTTPLLDGRYIAAAANSNTATGGCYAARSDKGVDWIHNPGSGWIATALVTNNKYLSISGDATGNGSIYGATMPNVLPPLPQFLLGINQYSVPSPTSTIDPSQPMSITDAEYQQLKVDTGMNTVRFPLGPGSVGLDANLVSAWENGEVWDENVANGWPADWRGLDAVIDQFLRFGFTPYICAGAEIPGTRDWETMYIPEAARRAAWFTKLVAKHVHSKYGDNVVYGWYENINNLYPHTYTNKYQSSAEFPAAFRSKLSTMYGGSISALNAAWASSYASFDQVDVPQLWDGTDIPESAYQSRRTYDLRKAMDLLSQDSLTTLRSELAQIAPGAIWAGGCLHDGFNGMHDGRTVKPVRCTASIATHALTSDVIAIDSYQLPNIFKVNYRVAAKAAYLQGKKFISVETLAWSTALNSAMLEVGGPTRGVLLWAGKEDMCGLIMANGTRREAAIAAAGNMFQTIRNNASTYATYQPGSARVYFPDETYEYMVLRGSHLDSYERLCDSLPVSSLEPVFTSELGSLPAGVPVFVLERRLPRAAIDALNALGSRVVCPHPSFIDESGQTVARSYVPPDFYAQLNSTANGPALLGAFQREEEKERSVSFPDLGAAVRTSSFLAPGSTWAYNLDWNAIDGDHASGLVFADTSQTERIDVDLLQPRYIYGAGVQLFSGDIVGRARSVPEGGITVKTSTNGTSWTTVATVPSGSITTDTVHIRFTARLARYARFELGSNTNGVGTQVIGVSLLAQTDSTLPIAGITSPTSGQHIRGSVNVQGTARDTYFGYFQLSCATAVAPDNWILINGPVGTQVSSGSLGTWNTTGVPDGACTLKLYAEDSPPDRNSASSTVSVVVDNTPPVMTLLGDNPAAVSRGATYVDAGATATDQIDGDRTSQIQKTGSVDTSVPGVYTLTYDVSDSVGNAAATQTRQVDVVITIAAAKEMPDGAFVNCNDASVTAVFGDYYYVEEMDRSSGIAVLEPGHGLAIGDIVRENGTILTDGKGERYINCTGLTKSGSQTTQAPGTSAMGFGGADWGFTVLGGATGGDGADNAGLLVKVWGRSSAVWDVEYR